MIVVTGLIVVHPDDMDAVRSAAIVMMDETAKEQGCITYRFYEDLEHHGRMRVYEEWESEAALEAHIQSEHMQAWRAALGALRVLSRDVKVFEAGPARSL